MTAILDQKHYIEELNRHLSGTVTDLQAKMDSLEKTNSKLVEEVRRALGVQLWDCVRTGLILFNISWYLCVCLFVFFFSFSSADSRHRQNQLSTGRTGTAEKGERDDLAVQPEKRGGVGEKSV